VAIDVAHLRFDATGAVIHIPRGKADQKGKGADVTLPRMRGAVFRNISRHGTLEERLSGAGVRHILLRRAAMAKLTVHPTERLSPHGLRAGLITEAYLAGAQGGRLAS
jgi:hypothetical protein